MHLLILMSHSFSRKFCKLLENRHNLFSKLALASLSLIFFCNNMFVSFCPIFLDRCTAEHIILGFVCLFVVVAVVGVVVVVYLLRHVKVFHPHFFHDQHRHVKDFLRHNHQQQFLPYFV